MLQHCWKIVYLFNLGNRKKKYQWFWKRIEAICIVACVSLNKVGTPKLSGLLPQQFLSRFFSPLHHSTFLPFADFLLQFSIACTIAVAINSTINQSMLLLIAQLINFITGAFESTLKTFQTMVLGQGMFSEVSLLLNGSMG